MTDKKKHADGTVDVTVSPELASRLTGPAATIPEPRRMDEPLIATGAAVSAPSPVTARVKSFDKRHTRKYLLHPPGHYRQGITYPAGTVLEVDANERPGRNWELVAKDDKRPSVRAPSLPEPIEEKDGTKKVDPDIEASYG